jgi:hypothetical protein
MKMRSAPNSTTRAQGPDGLPRNARTVTDASTSATNFGDGDIGLVEYPLDLLVRQAVLDHTMASASDLPSR